jgi:hypothetical protein
MWFGFGGATSVSHYGEQLTNCPIMVELDDIFIPKVAHGG